MPSNILEQLDEDLSSDLTEGESSESGLLDDALTRFEGLQPALSEKMESTLGRFKEEPTLGFGYFLILSVYLAFERAFSEALREVDRTLLTSVEESLSLDEEIRMADPAEVVETDDIVAMEQPHVVEYVQEHVDAALEAHAGEIEVNDVHAIYRAVLVIILALSYSVKAPEGALSTEFEA